MTNVIQFDTLPLEYAEGFSMQWNNPLKLFFPWILLFQVAMFAGMKPILPIYPQTEESQEPFQSLLTWQSMAQSKNLLKMV